MTDSETTADPVAEVDLPAHPRLLPGLEVLERKEDTIQIGLDPEHAVVIRRASRRMADALRAMDGRKRIGDLLSTAGDEQVERFRAVLAELTFRGLIEDAGPPSRVRREGVETGLWPLRIGEPQRAAAERRAMCAIAVHGNGRLAVALAILLATAGIGHIMAEASGRVTDRDLGSGYLQSEVGLPRAKAMVAAVHRANPATRTTRLAGPRRPDLVLLTDAVVPAPEVVAELLSEMQPHLQVRIRDGTGIIGPLVIPGRSSCLRCADLHRTGMDPCWPVVASQLAGRTQQADLANVHLTAALAAGQVLRALGPSEAPPPVWNATLELDAFDGAVRQRPWVPHPRCDCGAS